MTPSANKHVHVYITGRVQGVWFRGWTKKHARALGLRGWVRNLGDGRVEAVFVGAPESVEQMLQRCHDGPPAARVDQIDVSVLTEPDTFTGFETRPTQ